MKLIQIRHVPDNVHRTLKSRAAMAGMSLSDYLLREIAHMAESPSYEELYERAKALGPVALSESPADALRAERDSA